VALECANVRGTERVPVDPYPHLLRGSQFLDSESAAPLNSQSFHWLLAFLFIFLKKN
jgi:hypothetical protein